MVPLTQPPHVKTSKNCCNSVNFQGRVRPVFPPVIPHQSSRYARYRLSILSEHLSLHVHLSLCMFIPVGDGVSSFDSISSVVNRRCVVEYWYRWFPRRYCSIRISEFNDIYIGIRYHPRYWSVRGLMRICAEGIIAK